MLDRRILNFAGSVSVCSLLLAGAGVGVLAVFDPVAAQPLLAQAANVVNCATSVACFTGNNSTSGAGLTGTSVKGPGLHGTSTSGIGLTAISASNFGIRGTSTSGSAGVVGTTPNQNGVYGYTTDAQNGMGVFGYSPGATGAGVYGETTDSGYGTVGVAGSGTGVYGSADSGVGLIGISGSGDGARTSSSTGIGLQSSTSSGTAVYASAASGLAVLGTNSSGNGADFTGSYIGTVSRAPASGFPFVATDNSGNNLFYVDGAGNISYHGGLFHFIRTKLGTKEAAFGSTEAAPTIEDTGNAQLVAGAANVRLYPAFAAALDGNSSYHVFVTPRGDTRGLYVAATTPTGFAVRESQGGRATVGFDYRIVATPLGETGRRISLTSSGGEPRAALPVIRVVRTPPAPPKPAAPR